MAEAQRLEEMENLLKETISLAPSGKWDWNDDTQSLDFTCLNSCVEIKEKRKKTTSTYQEAFRKHLERISQSKLSARGGQCRLRKTVGPAHLNAFKAAVKRSQGSSVTIDHVKQVALSLVQDKEALPIPLCFLTIIKSGEMDDFLASLLLYLSCHLESKALEEHFNALMVSDPETPEELDVHQEVDQSSNTD